MGKGVIFSVAASVFFGILYYFVTLLRPLSGLEVVGWRILITFPLVALFIVMSKEWGLVREVWQRVRAKPSFFCILVINSLLMGVQFWLYMWAPMNGRGLQVSLGYFLLPLTLVFMGRIAFGEKLSNWQKAATACAILGVGNQLYFVGSIAWEALLVSFGYMLYFYMRRRFGVNHIGGLLFDIGILIPPSLWFMTHGVLSWEVLAQKPSLYYLIPIMGLLGTAAWVTYVLACKYLSFSLFGLLSYLEPVLLVWVSLLLGERVHPQEMPTYILIMGSIFLLVLEGVWQMWSQRTNAASAKTRAPPN